MTETKSRYFLQEQEAWQRTLDYIQQQNIAMKNSLAQISGNLISNELLENLINSNPDVMRKFIRILANNVTDRESQLLALAYNSLRKKVAESILAIHKKFYNKDVSSPIDISREDLANIAGTAKESVIRTLSDFKEEKLIDIKTGDIIILDEKKLRDLLN